MSHQNVTPLPGQGAEPPAGIAAPRPTDLLDGTDGQFADFLESGHERARRGRYTGHALTSASAINDVLGTLHRYADVPDGECPVLEPPSHSSLGRLAWLAQTIIQRAQALQERREGHARETRSLPLEGLTADLAVAMHRVVPAIATILDRIDDHHDTAGEIARVYIDALDCYPKVLINLSRADLADYAGAAEYFDRLESEGGNLATVQREAGLSNIWLVSDKTAEALRPLAVDLKAPRVAEAAS